MKEIKIKLNSEKEAVDFVAKISVLPYDIDLVYGHYVVDAKSILGVLSVAPNREVALMIQPEDAGDLKRRIEKYIAI